MAKRRKARPRPAPYPSTGARAAAYRRWRRWFKHLRGDIITLALHRHIYRETRAMIEANPALHRPSTFYDWMQQVYVNDMALAIRRLVDWDHRAVSLVRLFQEIEDHPEVITRRRFVSRYPRFMREAANRDFEQFAKSGSDQIQRSRIRRDRRELVMAQRRLRQFVNRHIAHRDRYPMRRLPTFAELNTCVDILERLVGAYALLIEQEGLARVVPVIQEDWKAPFRIPWIGSRRSERGLNG